MTAAIRNDLGWMLDDSLKIPGTRHAVLLSADGLLMAHSQQISRDDAERFAASMAGQQALVRCAAEFCGAGADQWQQSITDYSTGYIVLVAAGPGAYLAVSATEKVDLEALTYRIQDLIQRLGQQLVSPPRQASGSPE